MPQSAVPGVTRLFADVMARTEAVRAFYPAGFGLAAAPADYPVARRTQVAEALERQNRAWGASEATLDNIKRLREGAAAVVTGQQVGLFGGPLFAIYKALTAVKLAAESTQAGKPAVPIFWLATEDHDLAEVNHTTLLTADATLVRVTTPTRGAEGAPMSAVSFGDEIVAVVAEAIAALGASEATEALRAAYKPGESIGSAFARLYSKVFAHSSVILLDASDPELHRIATPIYTAAFERCRALHDALAARDKQLEKAGYHSQVKVSPSQTLLFVRVNGSRVPLRRANGGFALGDKKLGAPEVRKEITEHPAKFSPNVLLRPVVQDHLLPTLAYVGGPAEVAYFAQVAVVYQELLGRVTPVVPRFAATLVESRIARLLEKYHLRPEELFAGSEKCGPMLAGRNLPLDMEASLQRAKEELEKAIASMQAPLAKLDPTLQKAAEKSAAKMRYQLNRIQEKAARAHLQRSLEMREHMQQISNALYPNGHLQEREIAGISFLARYGPQLLLTLYDAMQAKCVGHQVVYL